MSTLEMLVFVGGVVSVWYFTTETYQKLITRFLPHGTVHARAWRTVATLAPVVLFSSGTITIGLSAVIYSDLVEDIVYVLRGHVPIYTPSYLQVLLTLSIIVAIGVAIGFKHAPAEQIRSVPLSAIIGADVDENDTWGDEEEEGEEEEPVVDPFARAKATNEIHIGRGAST